MACKANITNMFAIDGSYIAHGLPNVYFCQL